MSEHPMNLSSLHRRRKLEQLSDDELRYTMMEASAILRQRERKLRDEFRMKVDSVWARYRKNHPDGGSNVF